MLLCCVYVLYHQGGTGVSCTPFSAVLDPSCALSGTVGSTIYLMVISFILLYRIRPSEPMYIRGWGAVGALLGLGISQRSYLNRLTPTPFSHCRRWTLILCAGTLDPWMNRCVERTKLMAIILLTYPHVMELGCRHFVAKRLDITFRVSDDSTPSSPSREATWGEKC